MEGDNVIERNNYEKVNLFNEKFENDVTIEKLEGMMQRDKLLMQRLKEMEVMENKGQHSSEESKRKKMARAQDSILRYMLKMMEVCNAQGFVYGIIPEKGKPVIGASDNLRQWWKEKVKFDRNGPAAIAKYQADNNRNGTFSFQKYFLIFIFMFLIFEKVLPSRDVRIYYF